MQVFLLMLNDLFFHNICHWNYFWIFRKIISFSERFYETDFVTVTVNKKSILRKPLMQNYFFWHADTVFRGQSRIGVLHWEELFNGKSSLFQPWLIVSRKYNSSVYFIVCITTSFTSRLQLCKLIIKIVRMLYFTGVEYDGCR